MHYRVNLTRNVGLCILNVYETGFGSKNFSEKENHLSSTHFLFVGVSLLIKQKKTAISKFKTGQSGTPAAGPKGALNRATPVEPE
jgi:hypothetical protein